jgi:hypothetical protein
MFARLAGAGVIVAAILQLVFGTPSRAQDAFETTTELGVTVTAEDILDTFDQWAAFWPVVCKYIDSPQFTAADEAVRRDAGAYLRQVRDELYGRLMGDDQAAGADLIRYVQWNVRRAHFLRELKGTASNREAAAQLRGLWYGSFSLAALSSRTIDPKVLPGEIESQFKPLGPAGQRHQQQTDLYASIATCLARMQATQTGQVLLALSQSLQGQRHADLVRKIVAAADWACVMNPRQGPPRRDDFVAAWEALNGAGIAASAAVGR